MKRLHVKSTLLFIMMVIPLCFIPTIPITEGAAGDPWFGTNPTEPIEDPNGVRYTEYIEFELQNQDHPTTKSLVPVTINPTFDDNRCNASSLRILHYNDTDFVEMAYQNTTSYDYYPSGYLDTVNLTFIIPDFDDASETCRLYWTYNGTGVQEPNYAADFYEIEAPDSTQFYNETGDYTDDTMVVGFSVGGSNSEISLLIQKSGSTLPDVISAELEYEGLPYFDVTNDVTGIDLGSGYDGEPLSIKMVDGNDAGWSTNLWLMVGTHNSTMMYEYSAGTSSFSLEASAEFSSSVYCLGLEAGDIRNDGTYEVIVGLQNGTALVYSFDGNTLSDPNNCSIYDKPRARNAWGVGVTNAEEGYVDPNDQLILATGHQEVTPNRGFISYFNESTVIPGVMDEVEDIASNFELPSYQYSGLYGPNTYVEDFIPESISPGEEMIIVSKYVSDVVVTVGNVDFVNDNDTYTDRNLLYSSDGSSYGGWTFEKVNSFYGGNYMTALSYSNKLNTNPNNYTILVGSSSGMLNWYNLTTQSGSQVKLEGGSGSHSHFFGLDAGALVPITGNFDNERTSYDDVIVVTSKGDLYFMQVDPDTKNLEVVTEQVIAAGVDFTNIGQSVAKADLTGDATEEIIVAGDDGKIRIINVTFPENIRLDIGELDYSNPNSQYSGSNTYNITGCTGFEGNLTEYITNYPNDDVNIMGKLYHTIPINITTESAGFVRLLNLNVTYNTSDYSLVDTPAEIQFVVPFGDETPTLLDNDQDNYPDVFEFLNITSLTAGTISLYDKTLESLVVLSDGDALPDGYQGMNPWNNDTDGDGIRDGYEIKGLVDPNIGGYTANNTNPLDVDTDGDGLSDIDELITYQNLFGANCVKNIDFDNDGLNDTLEFTNEGDPQDPDTDDDNLFDNEEYFTYKSVINDTDTDDDGISDYVESGKNPSNNVYNFIGGFQRVYSWKADGSGLNLSNSDSDGDGLSDYDEVYGIASVDWTDQLTARTHYSDPTLADTDGDTINDNDEINGKSYSYYEATDVNGDGLWELTLTSDTFVTNPQSQDTDNDDVDDNIEETYFINPVDEDTDGDNIDDGEEIQGFIVGQISVSTNPYNPDTDNDTLKDGVERNGQGYLVGSYSDPTKNDTDGDGWLDGYEVKTSKTKPTQADSDGDGLIDSEDPMPMLSQTITILAYILVGMAIVTSIISYPLNRRAARVATRRKIEYQNKLNQITNRIERERQEAPRVITFARMMPSDLSSGKINVKINVRVTDESFYCRQVKLHYSATGEYKEITMDKIDDNNFSVVLANIPVDMTILYYLELLDRGGVWLKQLRNEEAQEPFEFSTSKDGVQEKQDWYDPDLIKCEVCGYMCRKHWDECPECNTPLYDTSQEIFLDEQKAKERQRAKETDPDEIAWQEAQETDEFWKALPECPSCNYTVQPDWSACPVCGFDLQSVELKKKAVYDDVEADWDAMMGEEHETLYDDTDGLKSAKETKKDMEKEAEEKKKKEADEWGTGTDDRDVL